MFGEMECDHMVAQTETKIEDDCVYVRYICEKDCKTVWELIGALPVSYRVRLDTTAEIVGCENCGEDMRKVARAETQLCGSYCELNYYPEIPGYH